MYLETITLVTQAQGAMVLSVMHSVYAAVTAVPEYRRSTAWAKSDYVNKVLLSQHTENCKALV